MKADIRNLHELNMEGTERHCPVCHWYGNTDECDDGSDTVSLACPDCDEETEPMYVSRELARQEIRSLIGQMAEACILLTHISDKLYPMFSLNGITGNIELKVIVKGAPHPDKDADNFMDIVDDHLALGSYRNHISTVNFDHALFRVWINGLADLIEEELNDD